MSGALGSGSSDEGLTDGRGSDGRTRVRRKDGRGLDGRARVRRTGEG